MRVTEEFVLQDRTIPLQTHQEKWNVECSHTSRVAISFTFTYACHCLVRQRQCPPCPHMLIRSITSWLWYLWLCQTIEPHVTTTMRFHVDPLSWMDLCTILPFTVSAL